MPEENYVLPFRLNLEDIAYEFYVKPRRYHLKLAPYFERNELSFDGEVSINFENTVEKSKLKLHAKNLEILGNINLKKDDQVYESSDYNIGIDNGESVLTINFGQNLPVGDYTLFIKFKSQPNYSSEVFKYASYTDNNGKREWILLSDFETEGTQEVFPCWNKKSTASKFNVSIKHNKAYTVLFNSPVKESNVSEDDPDSVWTSFEELAAFTPHRLAFIIGNLELMSAHHNDPFRLWFPKNTIDCEKNDIKIIEKLWKALEIVTGITHKEHPFNKMDVVVLPEFIKTKKRNWGLCTINDVSIEFKENIDKAEKVETITGIAALMIDHWFGELIKSDHYAIGSTISYGFRLYLAELVVDEFDKTWRAIDRIVYLKGRSGRRLKYYCNYTARTIHHILGEENFRKVLRNFILNNGLKDTIISPLRDEIMNTAGDKKEPIKNILDTWCEFITVPTLAVTRDYEASKAVVTEPRFFPGRKPLRYWFPLNWANEQELDFEDTSVTQWFDGDFMKTEIPVTVPADRWIIVNKQHFGTYRVTYDEKNWKMIVKYMNSDNYSKIHIFNRIQLINDAFTIADWGFLDYSVPFELAKYLSRETEFAPWTTFLHYIEQLYNESPLRGSPYFDNFKKYVLEVTDELEKRILLTDEANDDFTTRQLRSSLVSVRCIFGSSACGNYALTKLKNWLEDPDEYPIPDDMKDVILKSGIRFADEDTWNKLWERYQLNLQSPENKKIVMGRMERWQTSKEEDILNALSCTPSFELLKKFIMSVPEKVFADIVPRIWFINIVQLNEKGVDAILDILESKPTKENGEPLFEIYDVFEGCQAVKYCLKNEDQVAKFNRVRTQYSHDKELNILPSLDELAGKASLSNVEKKLNQLKTYFDATN
ncbi:aminopeptidase N-like [Cotesia typhae]|uniref:aminopeptidase N-like n=1 Tax=Cotesia typhae TaxID=2053667 RepID=UPI003D687B97